MLRRRQGCCLGVRSLAAFLFLAVGAAPLAARQTVEGSVLDGGARTPVEGAMVVLLEGETPRSRALTAQDGSFRLTAPGPGEYLLRVDRIGYESMRSEPFDLGSGALVQRTLLTKVHPVTLAGIDVEGSRRCVVRLEVGLAVERVWEQARKALDAASWTTALDLYRFAWTRYQRSLGPNGYRVLDERRSHASHLTPQPFRGADARTLAREGYIQTVDGSRVFYAPDASVLLSDSFLATHCLSLERRVQEGERQVGLRFRPVDRRDVADVEGVLWLSEEGARLRSMDYRYVDPTHRLTREEASGEMVFRGLPNGTWIIQEWRIRIPALVGVQSRYGEILRYQVTGYREEGGVVDRIATRRGDLIHP